MSIFLSRAFRAVVALGVTIALAACSAQTPEVETGSARIGQPATTVGGSGVTRVVFPTQDLVTPAQQLQKMTKVETESGEALYVALGLMTKTTTESGEVVYVTASAPQLGAT